MTEDLGVLVRRLVHLTTGLMVAIGLILAAGTGYAIYDQWDANSNAEEQRKTLCLELEKLKRIQREDLQADIQGAQAILDANPGGVPGFTPETIRADIAKNMATVAKLAPIECETFAKVPKG